MKQLSGLVVIDAGALRELVTDAVRSALASLPSSAEYVDAKSSPLGSRWTFLRLAKAGAFPVSRMGRKLVAKRADVEAWIASQRREPEPAAESETDAIEKLIQRGKLRAIR